jgi:hypothetical protein
MTRGNGLKLPRTRIILQLALVSAPFIVSQSAAAAVSTSAAQVSSNSATVSEKQQRQRSLSAAPGDTGRTQRGIGQAARANSDRVRSLLSRQAPRPKNAVAASRRGAASTAVSSRGATAQNSFPGGTPRTYGGAGPRAVNQLQDRTNLSQRTASAPSNAVAPRTAVAPPQNSAARTGTLGGPRAQGHAMLGGPAIGKAARGALDGAQLLRRKY